VYVKYDGFASFGEGKFITMPIKILQVPELIQSTEPFRVPNDWNPTPGCDCAYLYQEDEKLTSDYMQKIYIKNWKNWYSKIGIKTNLVVLQNLFAD
jgi:hypothetical protein